MLLLPTLSFAPPSSQPVCCTVTHSSRFHSLSLLSLRVYQVPLTIRNLVNMIAKLSILSTAALALSPVFVAADSHDSLQRRHGHVGPNRLPMNNTFSLNTVSTNHTLDKRYDNARFTMYYQTGNAGACGIFNSDADFVRISNFYVVPEVELRCVYT